MKPEQQIMAILAEYGTGEQMRFMNELLKSNGIKSVAKVKQYKHESRNFFEALGLPENYDPWFQFASFMNDLPPTDYCISRLYEHAELDAELNKAFVLLFSIIVSRTGSEKLYKIINGDE